MTGWTAMPADTRLKILHVIPSLALLRGGPSKAAIDMTQALRKQNVDARIITTNDNGDGTHKAQTGSFIDYQGVPVHFFKRWSPPSKALREFAYAVGFSAWLKANIQDYDVLHIHAVFSYCPSIAMKIARAKKVPYIVRPIGQLQPWSLSQSSIRKEIYLKLFEQKNLEQAQLIHCTSEQELKQTQSRFPTLQIKKMPLGVLIPEKKPRRSALKNRYMLDADSKIIITMSRLHPKKGLELLLSSLALQKRQNWQLLVAGTGDKEYLAQLKKMSHELGIGKRCHFIGFIDGEQKTQALQSADLFVLSSYSENFGLAVVESMACGTAPLITNQVGIADQILENDLGFVCKPEIESIAQALNSALNDPSSRKRKALAAQAYARREFSWPTIANQLIDTYQTISKQLSNR